MSDLDTLKSAIYSDVTSAVSPFVSDVDAHVIRESDDEPDSPPMVALNGTSRVDDSQVGLYDVRVIRIETNPLDILYGRDRTFSVDVTIADTDGSRADSIYDAIANGLTYDNHIRDPQSLVSGDRPRISDVSVEDASPIGRDQRVGHVLVVEVDYTRTFFHSDIEDPPADVSTVKQTFAEGEYVYETSESGTDVYPKP